MFFKKNPTGGMSGAFTQGGQTSLHGLHMFRQVVASTMKLSLVLTILFWLGTVSYHTPYRRLYALWSIVKSWFMMAFSGDWDRATQWCAYPGMEPMMVSSWAVSQNDVLWHEVWLLFDQTYHALIPSFISFPVFWVLLMGFWLFRGIESKKKRIIEGQVLLKPKQGRRAIKKLYKPSAIELGGISLPENAPQQHIMIAGTTGVGKTNALRLLLTQIRAQGDRAIVVDLRGNFLSQFYEPSKDIILNPFDERSVPWNIFEECEDPNDMDTMAECLVQSLSRNETFWIENARILLATGLQKLRTQQSSHPHRNLVKHLLKIPLSQLQKLLADTEASSLVDPQGEKMAVSFRATLVKSLRSLIYCDYGTGESFSIRRWIHQEVPGNSWLWLSSGVRHRSSLKGLMASWIQAALLALREMPETPNRRLWLIIDELPQLGKIPSFSEALAEARAFGGCIVIGIQDINQLDEIYGHQSSRSCINLFGTKVLFRAQDYDIATRLSKGLGQNETSETIEGISYGSHEMRDGVSINKVVKQGFAVKAQDIMGLHVGHAILKTLDIAPIKTVFEKCDAVQKYAYCQKKTNLFEILEQSYDIARIDEESGTADEDRPNEDTPEEEATSEKASVSQQVKAKKKPLLKAKKKKPLLQKPSKGQDVANVSSPSLAKDEIV